MFHICFMTLEIKKIRAVYNQTETENLDVNLEATHSQNYRPFYENTNTMYFRDKNNFFEVPVNINTPSSFFKIKRQSSYFCSL